MFLPYCCWLVGVCTEPGKDGPPKRAQRRGLDRSRLRWRRAQRGGSGRKPHAVNHNVRKAAHRATPGRACPSLPAVLRFADYNNRAPPVWRAVAQIFPQRRKAASYSRLPRLPACKVAIVFSIFVVVRAEGQQMGNAIVVKLDHRAFAGGAHDRLCVKTIG